LEIIGSHFQWAGLYCTKIRIKYNTLVNKAGVILFLTNKWNAFLQTSISL
jgi:hypothetical protein